MKWYIGDEYCYTNLRFNRFYLVMNDTVSIRSDLTRCISHRYLSDVIKL